jgi:glutamate-ammonia-ligase adenylyltransferase
VAGDSSLAESFEVVRKNTLRRQRDLRVLATEVQEMREKMRKHLGQDHKDGKFALKQDSGGIVDIEFMVQFAVLAWSCDKPSIAQWTDTIRILEMLAQEGFLTEQQSQQLIDAYKIYRSAGHRLQLQNQPAKVPASEFLDCRNNVINQWQTVFDNS